MKKSEIFDLLLDKVAEVCEVKKEAIVNGSRLQAVVDARILSVQYLRRIGLSSDDIALIVERKRYNDMQYCPPLDVLKKKSKGIDRLFSCYSQRCLESYIFCMMSKDISEFCRNRYKEEYLSWMKELPK